MCSPATDAANDGDAAPVGSDLRMLSDADLIHRFKLVCALERSLHVPCADAGVHAAIACAARHNQADMENIVEDLVRRVRQRGQAVPR